jgi:hypothetical protein
MPTVDVSKLDHIMVPMSYTKPMEGQAQVTVWPPSSGRPFESPPRERVPVPVYDCRPIAHELTLDIAGFQLVAHRSAFTDFYVHDRVVAEYYPESVELMKAHTGALDVFIFDHNVRNQTRSDRGEHGVRTPTDGAHNDYTMSSGPRRIREVLEDNDASHLLGHRAAIINLWRPIVGPVQDHPLAICDARTTNMADFIPTTITHYLEEDLENPALTGEIYSFKYSDAHRWFVVSDMQPDEVVLLKCFDTAHDGRALFTGHTGFRNPQPPADAKPRESIELRTVVVFPELRDDA